MSYDILKNTIAEAIRPNGNQEITGQILQDVLLSIVDEVAEATNELAESKAEKNGTYPQMSVGKADALNTPSGSPLHSLFESYGAVWNDSTRFWELNGLTDLTNEDMTNIIRQKILNVSSSNISFSNAMTFAQMQARTNIEPTKYQPNNARYYGDGNTMCAESMIENLVLNSGGSGSCRFTNLRNAFYNASRLRKIVGVLDLSNCTDFNFSFRFASKLEEVMIINTKGLALWFNSSTIKLESLKYILQNCGTATFTLTVSAAKYAEANADSEFTTLLASKPNVTFASA